MIEMLNRLTAPTLRLLWDAGMGGQEIDSAIRRIAKRVEDKAPVWAFHHEANELERGLQHFWGWRRELLDSLDGYERSAIDAVNAVLLAIRSDPKVQAFAWANAILIPADPEDRSFTENLLNAAAAALRPDYK